MSLSTWWRSVFTSAFVPNTKAEGSAFFKVAAHETKLAEFKGALIALTAAETVSNSVLGQLESAAVKVHAGRDAIQTRINNLSKSLGL
jgi:hypothetical protein